MAHRDSKRRTLTPIITTALFTFALNAACGVDNGLVADDALSTVEQQNSDFFRTYDADEGITRVLHGDHLSPPECERAHRNSDAPEWLRADEHARCMLREWGSIFVRDGKLENLNTLYLTRHGPGTLPGEYLVSYRQRVEGLDVLGSVVTLFFIDQRLVSVSGDLFDPSRISTEMEVPVGSLRDRASLELDSAHVVIERASYVSPRSGGVVFEFAVGPTQVRLSASNGEVVQRGPASSGQSAEVVRDLRVHDYIDSFRRPPPEVPLVDRPAPVLRECTWVGCLIGCTFSRWVQDQTLDLLPPDENGERKRDFGGRRFPVRLSHYRVEPNKSVTWLGDFDEFDGCFSNPLDDDSPPSLDFYANNFYYYLTQAREMSLHYSSYLNYGITEQEFDAAITENLWRAGSYSSDSNRLEVIYNPSTYKTDATNLDTITHEFGHFIHDLYGNQGTGTIKEGWAQQSAFRYAIWERHVTGRWPGLRYDSPMNGRPDYLTGSEINQGEFEPTGGYYQFYPHPQLCANERSGTHYECGHLLQRLYWELAWNECRSAFGSCDQGEAVIQSGIFVNSPWKLANMAFAYAVSMMSSDGRIGEFFDHVMAAYRNLKNANYFDWDDYARVNEVLARHCVGWFDHCSADVTYRHLPGHDLPVAFTKKASFSDLPPSNQHFLSAANDMTRSGTVQERSHPTVDGMKFINMNSADDELFVSVWFPESGSYAFEASVRVSPNCCDSAWLAIDNGANRYWGMTEPAAGVWGWTQGPTLTVTAGWHVVRLKHREEIDVEALVISRQ